MTDEPEGVNLGWDRTGERVMREIENDEACCVEKMGRDGVREVVVRE